MPKASKGGPTPPGPKREGDRDWYAVVAAHSGLVAKLSAVVFVLALGYIVYAVYGGHLSGDVDPRIVRNIEWMGKALAAAAVVGAIALALATLDEVAYSIAAAVLGIGLVLGTPMLVISKLQQPDSPVADVIKTWTSNAGFAICGVVALRVIHYIVETIRYGPKARKKAQQEEDDGFGPKKVKRVQGVWSACWQLPYCHDTIREVCPAYKERKNCWKFGRGCNCDPTLVETMIRSGAARVGKGQDKVSAQKQVTADAYMREALGGAKKPAGSGGSDRTIECKKCPIYGEHQRQKFNIVNPIAIILTIALLVVAYPLLNGAYQLTIQALAKFASEMTLTQETSVGRWIGYLDTTTVRVFFYGILSLFLVSYVLKIVEWLVFVRKL
ncbi:MAG: hypothetical protein FJX74_15345 [Armatimonadetes bacterium]|nr:hypothetical protein [Armatimonadota bacterium]